MLVTFYNGDDEVSKVFSQLYGDGTSDWVGKALAHCCKLMFAHSQPSQKFGSTLALQHLKPLFQMICYKSQLKAKNGEAIVNYNPCKAPGNIL